MKTRFDDRRYWSINGGTVVYTIKEMETTHLLNTVKMLVQKPAKVLSMLVSDIEDAAACQVWTTKNDQKASLKNATSLTAEELTEYVKGTPLFNAMIAELNARGVNTDNVIDLYESSEVSR